MHLSAEATAAKSKLSNAESLAQPVLKIVTVKIMHVGSIEDSKDPGQF
jgi:hypothetical protein